MRDDPTARLNADGVPDDEPTRRSPIATLATRPAADDDGHAPGPGLMLPPVADRGTASAPTIDVGPGARPATDPEAGTCRLVTLNEDPSPCRAGVPQDADAGSVTRRLPGGRAAAPPARLPGGDPVPHRTEIRHGARIVPGRPAVPSTRSASAGPAAPSPPVRPLPVAPGRGPTPASARPATGRPTRRRAGRIVGGVVLGLVAVVAAAWTVVVPPGGDGGEPRPAAAPARPSAPAVRWVRTGGDEFDGPRLASSRWRTYDSPGAFGHGLRRSSAVSQGDGLLTITARPRLNGGTSGGVTMPEGQLHGRWEFRARADPGTGYSPAVLLWPDSERFPIDGELDMLEAPQGDRRTASAFVHYGADNRTRGAQVSGDFTRWHTFAMEWLPDRITWYVDGRKEWEVTDRSVIPTTPMHLCIQLDQGPAPKFMPGPDASTPDQVRMQVDWARQYRVG